MPPISRLTLGPCLLGLACLLTTTLTTGKNYSPPSIKRSPQARAEFKQQHPCPATGKARGACPGWVIDHVVPLKRGGPDTPSNMQWQTQAEAKAKDRLE